VASSRPPAKLAGTEGAARAELAAALAAAMDGEVAFDDYTRHLYSRDASMYAIEPAGVVFPRDADDAAALMSVARRFGVPVLARGAGTSLAGQAVSAGIVADFSRHMNKIIEVDAEAMTARVQPGVVQDQLNRAAADHGLMFGPDTSTANRATIGGMIGNNSAGSHSVRYGMTIDHVRGLDVVLSDASRAVFGPVSAERWRGAGRSGAGGSGAGGSGGPPPRASTESAIYRELPGLLTRNAAAIATGYPKYWRQSGGYRLDVLARLAAAGEFDLARFVTGSEGTLVIVTEATVALVPAPRHRVIAVGHFLSEQAAIEATVPALECEPAAVELLDRTIIELSRGKVEYRALGSILHGDPGALLFVTFFGNTLAEAVSGLDRLDRRWQRGRHGYFTLRAVDPADQAALLKVRSAGLGLLMAASTGTRRPLAFVEDTAVDPSRLADYARRLRQVIESHGLTAGFYGHASVGCLHVRPFVDLAKPGQVAVLRAVAEQVRELVAEFGGVNSSEHGDGLARSEFNEAIFGPGLYQAMREVKALFDPEGLLNPGKITGAAPMTQNLRDVAAAGRPVVPLATRLTFAPPGADFAGVGMLAAADRCMNIGLCRKSGAGVMCPSYMVTGDEEHSTRGRAAALVKALSEPDPHAALGGERLHGILDLCLECKACKSECPLGVDLATLKSEALAAYYDSHGIPLRARAFGSIRALNRLGSALAPAANALVGMPPARRARERILGITAARPLPRFERPNISRWFAGRPAPDAQQDTRPARGDLIFLADCFTSYTDTSVAKAAIGLLELAGWRVRLADVGCCGRASYSKGLLDQARRMAARLTTHLAGLVAGGSMVTGAEPSCVFTLREEYLAMLPGDDRAAALAAAVRPVEELLLEALANGSLAFPSGGPLAGRRVVFHGHCHQKTATGTAATVALLRAIPGAEVTELDAGCCGMAGSFGFEAEHYDLSMRIGELRLFPAVRAEPEATMIAASGVSCRQQIRHGTGRAARHPLEIVLEAAGPVDHAAEPS
jgi:FAD/FMN-containing dehydrogenase/Fe-S oxidoreductase